MKKKIKFYKDLLIEVIETLIGICILLEKIRGYHSGMMPHIRRLGEFSYALRQGKEKGVRPEEVYKDVMEYSEKLF